MPGRSASAPAGRAATAESAISASALTVVRRPHQGRTWASARATISRGGDAVGGRPPARHQPVRQRVGGEILDVLGQRVVAAAERGARPRGGGERQRAARRDGVLDEARERRPLGFARSDDEADDEVLERRREVDAVGGRLRGVDGRGAEARALRRRRRTALGLDEVEDCPLDLGAGERELHVEEEAVELRLGQREGALVLDRVLGGHHHEGVGQGPGDPAGGDLPLGHGLEERRLHLGRGAVDLVDQHERVEERAGDEVEAPVVGAEHLGAGHVGRHEVGRALDAREARVEAGGERLDGAGLGEARRPLDQDVPAGEDADGEPLDQPLVADEPRRDGFGEACDGLEGIGDALLVERHAVLLIDPGRDWHGSEAGATRGDLDFRLTWAGRAKVRRGMVAIEVCRVGANTGEHRQWRPFCEHLLKRGSTGNVYGSLAPVKFSIS